METSVILNQDERQLIVFAVNRSLEEDMMLDFTAQGCDGLQLKKHIELYCVDVKATNSADKQVVAPCEKEITDVLSLRKHSWNMLIYKY